jgi:predicted glycoside hydrolase/deacetylase ChbG (UPF0249 family)
MKNQVIKTADDYGVCNLIDNGIIKALRARSLTTVSAIVTHPSYDERISKLVELQKELKAEGFNFGIGLHFCITSGQAVFEYGDQKSSLVEEGKTFREFSYYPFRKIKSVDVAQELLAQIAKLSDIIGEENIDHLANHHNIVYFNKGMFEAYANIAAQKNIPIRTPMSWFRKFKDIDKLPDFDDKMLSGAARRGMKVGMWRKFPQTSYGNLIKRMSFAFELNVKLPDVLCEFIYGACDEQLFKDKGERIGIKVIDHSLKQFETGERQRFTAEAHERTATKAKRRDFDLTERIYLDRTKTKNLSMELIFHLADSEALDPLLVGIPNPPDEDAIHGINPEYFDTRKRELSMIKDIDWPSYKNSLSLNYITFKEL